MPPPAAPAGAHAGQWDIEPHKIVAAELTPNSHCTLTYKGNDGFQLAQTTFGTAILLGIGKQGQSFPELTTYTVRFSNGGQSLSLEFPAMAGHGLATPLGFHNDPAGRYPRMLSTGFTVTVSGASAGTLFTETVPPVPLGIQLASSLCMQMIHSVQPHMPALPAQQPRPAPPPPGTPPVTAAARQRATDFVRRVASIADAGGVPATADIEPALHSNYTATHATRRTQVLPCGAGGSATETSQTMQLENTWFHAMPDGVAHMQFPGFTINPGGETGAPMLTYTRNEFACAEAPAHTNGAKLRFDNIPAYACITGDALLAAVPGIRQGFATDGFLVYGYTGRIDQSTTTTVHFSGRAGGACIISAEIEHLGNAGYRALRAQYKAASCQLKLDQAFCATHPGFRMLAPFGGTDTFAIMQKRRDDIRAQCGTNADYYAQEPVDGPIPPPPIQDPYVFNCPMRK
jgi:hypothetical protein